MAAKKRSTSSTSKTTKKTTQMGTGASAEGGTGGIDIPKATAAARKRKAPAAVTTPPEAPNAEVGDVERIPTTSGSSVEVPTETPQSGALTGSPSWMPPGGIDVAANAPGVPEIGTPAADLRGTPKPSAGGEIEYVAPGEETTVELSQLEAVTRKVSTEPEVVLTFTRGADEVAARAAREAAKLKPGTAIRIRYLRTPEDLGQHGTATRIEVGYQFDALPSGVATVADGQRSREGELVRKDATLRIPPEASREMLLWFKIELSDGRTLWDSVYGQNYRYRLA